MSESASHRVGVLAHRFTSPEATVGRADPEGVKDCSHGWSEAQPVGSEIRILPR